MKESWIRKNIKNVGVGVLATVGSLAIHGNVDAQKTKDANVKNPTEQSLMDSIEKLAENLLAKNKITSIDSSNESGQSNIYDGNIGKYEVEFYDQNRNKKLDGEMERFSINYEDENGTSFSIDKKFDGLSAYASSFKKQVGFEKMTVGKFEGKYAVALRHHNLDEIIYVRNLTNSEIQKTLDDIKIIQLQENLQK